MSLLPKEHGAYGQMAFPLATAFAVAGMTTPAVLTGVAVVAGFLAHEPLLVLLGMRGPRARREQRGEAVKWLLSVGMVAVGAGIAAVWMTPTDIRWSFVLPLVPALLLAVAIATGRERSWQGEVAVALAFSFTAVPMCLAAGTTTAVGLSVAIPFALLFVGGTLAVRVVILRVRRGGDPRAVAATRGAVLALAAGGVAVLAATAALERLPWTVLLATAPGLIMSTLVALFPPSPIRLRSLGWTLVATSVLTAVLVVMN